MKTSRFINILALGLSCALWGCSPKAQHDHDHEHEHDHAEEAAIHDEHDEHGEHKDHDEHEGHDEHDHEGAIVLKPEQAERFGVSTATFAPTEFAEIIRVSGRIEPAPSDIMTVTARKSGIITLAQGITQGKSVNAGTLIGSISAKGVQGGDANAAAHATLESAKRELDRLTPLYKEGLVTASTYNAAEQAYKEAAALSGGTTGGGGGGSEVSPCAGTVTDIMVSSGQYVEVGTPIATVAKSSKLTLRADLPERYTAHLAAIQGAKFRPDYADTVFSIAALGGQRISASTTSGAKEGYIPVYFSFNSNGATIPGAYTEVYLQGAPRSEVYTLPRTALIEMQGNRYAYVKVHGDAFEKRLVKTGASDGERVEILSGINPGEEVVTAGATIVRMAETSAIAPPGHTHNH